MAKDPSIVGTPFYMAPETIRGKARGVESAADWWSFGVIMYEFLLGFPPFQGAKVGEIYRSILSLSFAAPIANCAVSPESADLISRLLVADPRRRLVSVVAVMSHRFFSPIEWQQHAYSAGHHAPAQSQPTCHAMGATAGAFSQSLHSLAAVGGCLSGRGSVPQPPGGVPQAPPIPSNLPRAHSGGSKSAADGVSVDALGVASAMTGCSSMAGIAMSNVGSVGFESERSAASTTLAELATEHNETHTSHLDNLMALNCSTSNRIENPAYTVTGTHDAAVADVDPMESGA